MEVENQVMQSEECDDYVDWRNKPARRGRHGGFRAASFVLGVEIMENMAFLANASNLVIYVLEYMHFSPSKASNTVTNFMGTAFVLTLLGGFISDAFFTTYHVYLTSAAIEFFVCYKCGSRSTHPWRDIFLRILITCLAGSDPLLSFHRVVDDGLLFTTLAAHCYILCKNIQCLWSQ